ncbi:MAG TPA: NAD(P)-binding domain-containing protein [Holophagaceae bacterium]|nr:NAD(P)-binding domain-containing protein [Holophagaceae bacterium]
MNIGILGSGGVAQTLAGGLIAKGHAVKLGTRDAAKLRDWRASAGPQGSVGSFAEAADFGDMVFICTLGSAALEAIGMAGAAFFKDKVVVDVTNPLAFDAGGPPAFTARLGGSLGEQIQRALPEAKVVKAFNTIAAAIMVNPARQEGIPTLTLAGDDPGAKAAVAELAQAFGWDVADLGGIEMAYWNEALAMIWILYGFKHNHWTHAFKLLRA